MSDPNNKQLKSVYNALVDFALRTLSKENTTGNGLEILPAVVDKIVLLNDRIH